MNFRTTCPRCASVFRLGPDQIEAAQGWVQCGVCGAAFDARPALLLEDGSPLPRPEPEAGPVASPEPSPTEPSPTEPAADLAADGSELRERDIEPAIEGTDEAATELQTPSDARPTSADAADEAANGAAPQGIAQREAPPDLPSIILIDPDSAPPDDDPGPLPHIAAPAYPAADTSPAWPPPPAYSPGAPAARVEYAAPSRTPAARTPGVRLRRRVPSWLWFAASVILLIGLLVQTTYFLRDPLASRYPALRPALSGACEWLGCTLSLPRNPALLRIVGSDLQTEASGRLKLTLTLGNRAAHAQAWPVLVLTLMDQRNRPLARRSFAPSEYLGDTARIAAGIPSRSEQALSLPLNVRNLSPMGYDLRLTF